VGAFLQAIEHDLLNNLLNVPVQIANEVGFQIKNLFLSLDGSIYTRTESLCSAVSPPVVRSTTSRFLGSRTVTTPRQEILTHTITGTLPRSASICHWQFLNFTYCFSWSSLTTTL
jgi:hypothetical protein